MYRYLYAGYSLLYEFYTKKYCATTAGSILKYFVFCNLKLDSGLFIIFCDVAKTKNKEKKEYENYF